MKKEFLNYQYFPEVTCNGDMNFIGAAITFFEENNARAKKDSTEEGHINYYNDVLEQLEDKHGILYLDNGNHFQIKE